MNRNDNDLLFVYGTLLLSSNEYGDLLKKNSSFMINGYIKGALYNAGEYPAAVYDPLSGERVYGSVFKLHFPAQTLKVLDDYEGFGKEYSEPNEFIRSIADVFTGSGKLSCWTYLYNLPVAGLKKIESGNYLKKSPEWLFRGLKIIKRFK